MDIFFWILLIAIIVIFGTRMMPVKGVVSINTAQLRQIMKDKNKQFIDVRTPGEYRGNHIKKFKNIPLHQLASHTSKLDPSKDTILICQSGMRSMQGARVLKKAGFTHLFNVRGGMNAWRP